VKDLEKIENGITTSCTFTETEVICNRYEQNPHGINEEIRCPLPEFLDNSTDTAKSCHDFIKSEFPNS